jgi:phosphoglycolate phosphatase
MRIQGVVFDLDGTLLNSLRDIAEAANSVLRAHGFPEHPVESYRHFIGEGVAQLCRFLFPPEHCSESMISQYGEQFRAQYEQHWDVHTVTYSGVDELLDELASRSIRMAVLSNKPHSFTMKCVDKYLARHSLTPVLGQREGTPRKPDPAGALEIAEALGIAPDRFLFLGDSRIDMETATRAGMHAIGALWGFREADELTQSGAKVLIERPAALLSVLDSFEPAAPKA